MLGWPTDREKFEGDWHWRDRVSPNPVLPPPTRGRPLGPSVVVEPEPDPFWSHRPGLARAKERSLRGDGWPPPDPGITSLVFDYRRRPEV